MVKRQNRSLAGMMLVLALCCVPPEISRAAAPGERADRVVAVRSEVLGNADREPSRAELERMKHLVERGLRAGAWGISSGLIYVPSRYARTAELIELAKVARRHGGFYASHIRNEEAGLLEA